MEMNIDPNTIYALAGGSVLGLAGLRKLYLEWMKQRPEVAAADAIQKQIESLKETLETQRAEIKELRAEVGRMDVVIHRQQTKLTRTEMLVRQFVGLVKENGITVPGFMQDELDDLLKPDERG